MSVKMRTYNVKIMHSYTFHSNYITRFFEFILILMKENDLWSRSFECDALHFNCFIRSLDLCQFLNRYALNTSIRSFVHQHQRHYFVCVQQQPPCWETKKKIHFHLIARKKHVYAHQFAGICQHFTSSTEEQNWKTNKSWKLSDRLRFRWIVAHFQNQNQNKRKRKKHIFNQLGCHRAQRVYVKIVQSKSKIKENWNGALDVARIWTCRAIYF